MDQFVCLFEQFEPSVRVLPDLEDKISFHKIFKIIARVGIIST